MTKYKKTQVLSKADFSSSCFGIDLSVQKNRFSMDKGPHGPSLKLHAIERGPVDAGMKLPVGNRFGLFHVHKHQVRIVAHFYSSFVKHAVKPCWGLTHPFGDFK